MESEIEKGFVIFLSPKLIKRKIREYAAIVNEILKISSKVYLDENSL